jgi:hypothetical protein
MISLPTVCGLSFVFDPDAFVTFHDEEIGFCQIMKSCKISPIGLNLRELLGDMTSRNSNIRLRDRIGVRLANRRDSELTITTRQMPTKRAKKYRVASAQEMLKSCNRSSGSKQS